MLGKGKQSHQTITIYYALQQHPKSTNFELRILYEYSNSKSQMKKHQNYEKIKRV